MYTIDPNVCSLDCSHLAKKEIQHNGILYEIGSLIFICFLKVILPEFK